MAKMDTTKELGQIEVKILPNCQIAISASCVENRYCFFNDMQICRKCS